MTTKEAVPKTTRPKRNPLDYPTRRFVGFALLLAWHYNLWFLHDAFIGVQLLDDCVTESWLFALVAAVIGFIAIAFALGRKRHLCERKWLYEVVTAIAFASTLVLTLFAFSVPTDAIAYALAAVIGASNALLWIMWGELYSRTKTSFSVARIGTTIGLVMLACSLVALVLPTGVSSVFISLLPVAACVLFRRGRRIAESMPYPTLLPESTAKRAIRPMIVVSVTAFVAALACYFLVAIIPLESLPDGDLAFTFGSIGGAVLLCIIGAVSASSKQRLNIYRIFPWLIVLAIISFALFITGEQFYIPSFFLVLAVVAIFEVLLIMYFGVLGMKGYVPIGIAFGFSGAFIRLGIAAGNTLALIYEANPSFALEATTPTAIIFVCILSAIVIPLVRQEYNITKLMAPPATESLQEQRIKELAREFSLSARETEIVMLIARGFTTDNVAKKLVISPYTVNTHIRHVYEKIGIHKRSELIDYINGNGSDESGN